MSRLMRLDEVDLEMLASYVDSPDYGAAYFEPATGQVYPAFYGEVLGEDGEPIDLDDVDWRSLGGSSRAAYADMERFADAISDPAIAGRLWSALGGKGSFRRFGDVVHRQPEELGRAWQRYGDLRSTVRAVEWLDGEGLLAETEAAERVQLLEQQALAVLAAVSRRGLR